MGYMETVTFTTSTFLIGEKERRKERIVFPPSCCLYGSICLRACACVGHKSKPTRPVSHSVLVVTLWTAEFNVGVEVAVLVRKSVYSHGMLPNIPDSY